MLGCDGGTGVWVGRSCVRGVARAACRRTRLRKGLAELSGREVDADAALDSRLRRVGSGRKRRTDSDPELLESLERLVDPLTGDDPDSPLRWTCKSTT